ncbi:MAG TPA: peptidoglycan recognition family protein [Bryobacteraceae bacterium]|nr:peptidoglycan recognition family protein [Bryobacteraceae bacterium]
MNLLQARWEPLLRSPNWYLRIIPEIHSWIKRLSREPVEVQDRAKARLYDFFEDHLAQGGISLGRGSSFDAERKRIDTIVLHHTSNPPGMRASRLSAIELIRLYGPYFVNPTAEVDTHLQGQPIYSGHIRHGQQVFWPYHWIVRENGQAERLLEDSEIGWHAGDWDVNCRSVGIVLDNDYEWHRPSDLELRGIARIIIGHYGLVPLNRIVGHREIISKTTCPSRLFLDGTSTKGWKGDLLALFDKRAAAQNPVG